jgi:hypothetical protein
MPIKLPSFRPRDGRAARVAERRAVDRGEPTAGHPDTNSRADPDPDRSPDATADARADPDADSGTERRAGCAGRLGTSELTVRLGPTWRPTLRSARGAPLARPIADRPER